MPEIDTGQKINFSGLIELAMPYFEVELEELWNNDEPNPDAKNSFRDRTKERIESKIGLKSGFEEIALDIALEDIIARQGVPIQKWRFNSYYLREKALISAFEEDKINPFTHGLPIFVGGRFVSNEKTYDKSGVDPYSKSHKLSDLILKAINELYLKNPGYKDFLENLSFVYLQPLTFIQMIRFENDMPFFIDYLTLAYGSPIHIKLVGEINSNANGSDTVGNDYEGDVLEEIEFKRGISPNLEYKCSGGDFHSELFGIDKFEICDEIQSLKRLDGKRTYSDFSFEIFDFSKIKRSLELNRRSHEKAIKQLMERVEKIRNANALMNQKTEEICFCDDTWSYFEDYYSIRKAQTDISKRIIGYKLAFIIEKNSKGIFDFIKMYQTKGLPSFMEKSSCDTEIMRNLMRYCPFLNSRFNNGKKNNGLDFIGGKHGPLEFAKEKSLGISDPSAIKKLCGFLIEKADIFSEGKNSIKGLNLTDFKRANIPRIQYESLENFPFFLIELDQINAHPNLLDMINQLIKTGDMTKEDLRLLRDYSRQNGVGWSRIEPRIVELFTNDTYVQIGLFSQDKRIGRWQDELRGKQILYPLKEIDFQDFVVNEQKNKPNPPDFRLSLFSLPTSPKLDKKVFSDNRFLGGCPIDKLIAMMGYEQKGLFLPGFMESKMARKGNLIHLISSMNYRMIDEDSGLEKELSHYKTLELLGIEAQSPDSYCETAFRTNIWLNQNHLSVEVGFHPDAYFLLGYNNPTNSFRLLGERKPKAYDIVVIDTKTNSFLPYFEHKYLLQTLSYGTFIKRMMKEVLNDDFVENIYVVLNKNAFHINMSKEKEKGTIRYRPQVFSPIVKFSKDDPFIEIFEKILYESIIALENLKKYPRENIERYYSLSKKEKYCDRCFYDHQSICESLRTNPSSIDVLFNG